MIESRDVAGRNAARRVDGEVLDKAWADGGAARRYRGGVAVLDKSVAGGDAVSDGTARSLSWTKRWPAGTP